MSRILIADDQTDVLEALRILLKGEGYQTDSVTSLPAARMRTKTYGSAKERLTNDCDDRSCRAQNRRVEIYVGESAQAAVPPPPPGRSVY